MSTACRRDRRQSQRQDSRQRQEAPVTLPGPATPRAGLLRRLAALTALAGAVVLACLPLGACSTSGSSQRPSVIVTTNILGDIVSEVVGDQAEVTTLMPPDTDPHSFGVSAQDALAMQQADLLVTNGLGLEEGLSANIETARESGTPVFVAGDHVTTIDYSSPDASGADPHFWTDPTTILDVVTALEAEILRTVPDVDAQALRTSAQAYSDEVAELDRYMEGRLQEVPEARRSLVTNHHVFGYLAARYGFTVIGTVIPGGATLAEPSASDLKDLATDVREAGVPAVFAESSSPDRLVQALAEQTGVKVEVVSLYTESLTGPSGKAPTYLTMMRTNTDLITNALSGEGP